VWPLAAESESHVEQALLYVLEEKETGTPTAADAGKCKQQKAGRGHQHGKGDIDLSRRYPPQPLRPELWMLNHEAE